VSEQQTHAHSHLADSPSSAWSVSLGELVAALGGELHGNAELLIARISPLEAAGSDSIAFIASPKYKGQLATTGAGCVIVSPALQDEAAREGRSSSPRTRISTSPA